MEYLSIFIFGLIFAFVGIPILQIISDLLFTWCEVVKSKASVVITEANADINRLNAEFSEVNTDVIGFQAPDDVEYVYEDEEEDCCRENLNKKIGF